MRSGILFESEKERSGAKIAASPMPELPVGSIVFAAEEICGDGSGTLGASIGQWRKPSVRRQPFSQPTAASSPYTGEPDPSVSLRSTAPLKGEPFAAVFWAAPCRGRRPRRPEGWTWEGAGRSGRFVNRPYGCSGKHGRRGASRSARMGDNAGSRKKRPIGESFQDKESV